MWKSDDPAYPRVDVYGSLDDLERDFGALPRNAEGEVDLHRPVHRRPDAGRTPTTPRGERTMRRIEDVFDVWFDSGSMPYAQVHYPFENPRVVRRRTHPADFIVEYIGQTRGWFYVMHVLSTALFDRPAFTRRLVPRHRARQRRPEDVEVAAELPRRQRGVRPRRLRRDALVPHVEHRCCAAATSIVTEEGIRAGVREFMLPLWNAWYFFATYANAGSRAAGGGYEATWRTDSTDVLDRYILAPHRRPRARASPRTSTGLDSTTAAERSCATSREARDQLVHPPLARPVLGGVTVPGTSRRGVRHARTRCSRR